MPVAEPVVAPVLEMEAISKSFGTTQVLDRVSLSIHEGEVLALLGENGAGKSTLMKILSGVWPVGSYTGQVRMGSECTQFRDTRDAHRAGVAMIHQELAVFPELTVAEHLELDRLPPWINWKALFDRTGSFLKLLGFGLSPEARVRDLSVGEQQMVEIARALYRDAKILVFDEPTAALSEKEVQRLYQTIDELKTHGKAIIYISHRMDEIFRLADRILVLRDGKNAAELKTRSENGMPIPRETLEPQIITAMVGRPIHEIYPDRNTSRPKGDEILRVQNLNIVSPSGKCLVKDFHLTLHKGEILGLGGLLGAGRSEVFEALFGMMSQASPNKTGYQVTGNVWVKGRRTEIQSPRDAMGLRIGFVSEDRKGNGLVLDQTILNNMSLPSLALAPSSFLALIDEKKEQGKAHETAKQLRIKCASLEQPVVELSGGNQQKVVLGKWIQISPEVLILDEPTRGVDVGSKAEIYQWIRTLANQGIGILMASSEMPELIGVSDRIVVLREGKVSAEFQADRVTQEDIMRAASL